MIVILGLVILVAALVAGVAGVLANAGHAHAVTHFAVFGYHVTGSTGTLFLYGIVVGALALAGLSVLAAGAGRSSRRGLAARALLAQSRRETAAVSQHRDDLISQRDTRAYTVLDEQRNYTASTFGDGDGRSRAGRDPGAGAGREHALDQGRGDEQPHLTQGGAADHEGGAETASRVQTQPPAS